MWRTLLKPGLAFTTAMVLNLFPFPHTALLLPANGPPPLPARAEGHFWPLPPGCCRCLPCLRRRCFA